MCLSLLKDGHEVHIVTGVFTEARGWQDRQAKHAKLRRLGIPFEDHDPLTGITMVFADPDVANRAHLRVLDAVPSTFDRQYRLVDLGLRKGAYCEEHGITLFFEDSTLYCEMIPKMSGNTLTLKVGEGK